MLLVFCESRVAAVDHEIAWLKFVAEFADDGVRDVTRRDHHPDQAGRGNGGDEFIHGGHVGHVRIAVKARDLHASLAQPFAHVETHFAKADQSDVHGGNSFLRWGGGGCTNWVAAESF